MSGPDEQQYAHARPTARRRQIEEFLSAHAAFATVPAGVVRKVAARLTEVELGDGESAVTEGEPGDAMYVIREGRVTVWIDGELVRGLRVGDFFGEVALVRGTTRTADVRADGPVSLLCLDRESFDAMCADVPGFASRTMELITKYEREDREKTRIWIVPRDPSTTG
jgi:CRP-like cAMP-binding protein